MTDCRRMFYPEGKVFTKEEDRDYISSGIVYNILEDIKVVMEDLNISVKELSGYLDIPVMNLHTFFERESDLDIKLLSDVCFELGYNLEIQLKPHNLK